jgi:hypothetical protein
MACPYVFGGRDPEVITKRYLTGANVPANLILCHLERNEGSGRRIKSIPHLLFRAGPAMSKAEWVGPLLSNI